MQGEEERLGPLTLDQLLQENMLLISAIHECRAAGHDEQGAQYSLRLHRNLTTVARLIEASKTARLRAQAAPPAPPPSGPAPL